MTSRRLILIAGPPGSGKTFLARQIQTSGIFQRPCVVSADWFYHSGLDDYDLPQSFDEPKLVATIEALEANAEMSLEYRDHSETGRLTLRWSDALIVEGLYVLSYPELTSRADIRIYLTTNLYLAGARRVLRDVLTHGDTVDRALIRLQQKVIPALDRFVAVQRTIADVLYSGDADWPRLRSRLGRLCS